MTGEGAYEKGCRCFDCSPDCHCGRGGFFCAITCMKSLILENTVTLKVINS